MHWKGTPTALSALASRPALHMSCKSERLLHCQRQGPQSAPPSSHSQCSHSYTTAADPLRCHVIRESHKSDPSPSPPGMPSTAQQSLAAPHQLLCDELLLPVAVLACALLLVAVSAMQARHGTKLQRHSVSQIRNL